MQGLRLQIARQLDLRGTVAAKRARHVQTKASPTWHRRGHRPGAGHVDSTRGCTSGIDRKLSIASLIAAGKAASDGISSQTASLAKRLFEACS